MVYDSHNTRVSQQTGADRVGGKRTRPPHRRVIRRPKAEKSPETLRAEFVAANSPTSVRMMSGEDILAAGNALGLSLTATLLAEVREELIHHLWPQ